MIKIYESFENLDDAKKQNIINAGFRIFGEYGYSKASIDDIVKEAGISKGSFFYYFVSKKNCFIYLYEYAVSKSKQLIDIPGDDGLPKYFEKTDFFERLDAVKERKINLTILYPYMNSFVKKAYFERSQDVYQEIQLINQRIVHERISDFFYKLDLYKFKDDVEPNMVLQLISWCSEGAVNQIRLVNSMNPNKKNDEIDYKEVIQLYDKYVSMIKKNFYKEKYL